ncbi:hypothetical protein B0H11DRAFT_2197843 [Mycena galericulata]|nr:hypothetical protein B0H11DRAFT_2197843 [Mycena galericulata]
MQRNSPTALRAPHDLPSSAGDRTSKPQSQRRQEMSLLPPGYGYAPAVWGSPEESEASDAEAASVLNRTTPRVASSRPPGNSPAQHHRVLDWLRDTANDAPHFTPPLERHTPTTESTSHKVPVVVRSTTAPARHRQSKGTKQDLPPPQRTALPPVNYVARSPQHAGSKMAGDTGAAKQPAVILSSSGGRVMEHRAASKTEEKKLHRRKKDH